jgi:hypothetical protein
MLKHKPHRQRHYNDEENELPLLPTSTSSWTAASRSALGASSCRPRTPPARGLQIRRILGIPVVGRPAKTASRRTSQVEAGEQRWPESAAQRRLPNNPPRRRGSKQRGAYDSPPWLEPPRTILAVHARASEQARRAAMVPGRRRPSHWRGWDGGDRSDAEGRTGGTGAEGRGAGHGGDGEAAEGSAGVGGAAAALVCIEERGDGRGLCGLVGNNPSFSFDGLGGPDWSGPRSGL